MGLIMTYGFFCELTNIPQNGLQPRSREILERECARVGNVTKAIDMIALELGRQNSTMLVKVLETVLHCSDGATLVQSSAESFTIGGRDDVAEAIQRAFV